MIRGKLNEMLARMVFFIFGTFLLFNFIYFIYRKPIINNFPQGYQFIWWPVFVLAIFVCFTILIFSSFHLLKSICSARTRTLLIILLISTVVPRLIWNSLINVIPLADFETYNIFATAMSQGKITGHGYISIFPHTIGYPAVLSVFYRIFGAKVIVAQILNVFLACGISLMLFKVGSILKDRTCGFFAAMIWALWPSQIFYTVLVSTEILFTFLMLLCIYVFLKVISWKRNTVVSTAAFFSIGVLAAVTNAIRPLALILIAAMIIYYLLFSEKMSGKRNLFTRIAFVFSLIIGYLVVSQIVTISISRAINKEVANLPIGFNLYVGVNYESGGTWNSEDSQTLTEVLKIPDIKAQEVHDIIINSALARIKARTLKDSLVLFVRKNSTMWLVDYDILNYIKAGLDRDKPGVLDFAKYENLLVKVSNLYYYIIMLLCLFGSVVNSRNTDNSGILFIVLIILGIVFLHAFVEVAGRYHFPAMSLFALVGSYCLINFKDFKRKKISL